MIFQYTLFLFGLIWSFSIIKTQSIFNKKVGFIFKIFISKISWFSFLAACYFGFKNFSIKLTFIGIFVSVLLVQLSFSFIKNKLKEKFDEQKLHQFKTFFEISLIILILYFILF
tara:strand:+ start:889 stop:1230 length:342 start_codon:yes stop_codon:yes gene_type:complete